MAILKVTGDSFQNEVLNADNLVMVDFWAPWCGPCKMMEPILEKISQTYQGQVKLTKINVDEEAELASQYSIISIPTILFFKNGSVVNKQVGAVPQHTIEEMLKKHI